MLRLEHKTQPFWLDLGMGVRVQVKPCDSTIFAIARNFMNREIAALGEEYRKRKDAKKSVTDLPDLEDANVREGLAEHLLTRGLARQAIIGWEGVFEAATDDNGKDVLAPVTPEKIDELMSFWAIASRFTPQYIAEQELLLAEKKD